ncbi:TlpA family protein disulfide reductase [Hylemonella sp. W303a]|uniref:TlpA family protein disulfide reductase n=1 Tax=Hylemonella sp. W303a TaxID=3389873 RepID=UPI00396B173B
MDTDTVTSSSFPAQAPTARAWRTRVLVLALAALLAGAGWWLLRGSGFGAAPQTTFVLLDGSTESSAAWRGKVVLVNFWATSCTTCVAEMPKIISTYDKYHAQGYETVAVAMSYDPPSYVVNFAQTRKLPFKVAFDNTGEAALAWGDVRLTPTTYLLNKQGEIVKRYVGEPDFAELHRLIEELLAQA